MTFFTSSKFSLQTSITLHNILSLAVNLGECSSNDSNSPPAFARWIQKLGRSLAGTSRTECCGFDQCNPASLLLVPLNGESQVNYFDATILTILKRKRKIRKESTPKPFVANPRNRNGS